MSLTSTQTGADSTASSRRSKYERASVRCHVAEPGADVEGRGL